eukprot:m.397073 g.397073  ORF g.397073 m.397073 type:complete len:951 (-) comp21121_c0_seq1:33-2885(-)
MIDRMNRLESEIGSLIELAEVDVIRTSQTLTADCSVDQKWATSVTQRIVDAGSDLRQQCDECVRLVQSRAVSLDAIRKAMNDYYGGQASNFLWPKWMARDLRTCASEEDEFDHTWPLSNVLMRMADDTEKVAHLQSMMLNDILEASQMPQSSTALGKAAVDIQTQLQKHVKAFETLKIKGKAASLHLARARKKLLLRFVEYMSSLYSLREQFEVDFLRQIFLIKQLQTDFFEQGLATFSKDKVLHVQAMGWVDAVKYRCDQQQKTLGNLSCTTTQLLHNIEQLETNAKTENKKNKGKLKKSIKGDEKESEISAFMSMLTTAKGCADCGLGTTNFIVANLGILLCTECARLHTDLTCDGNPFTKNIRPIYGDSAVQAAPCDMQLLCGIGSETANSILEARITALEIDDVSIKPKSSSSKDQKERFIREKYVKLSYVAPMEHVSRETLITCAATQDMHGLLHALVSGQLVPASVLGTNCLVAAVQAGAAGAAEFLLSNGAFENATTDARGNTPLHIAAACGHLNCVKVLLRHCAIHTHTNCAGNTPVDVADPSNPLIRSMMLGLMPLGTEADIDWGPTVPSEPRRFQMGTTWTRPAETLVAMSEDSGVVLNTRTGATQLSRTHGRSDMDNSDVAVNAHSPLQSAYQPVQRNRGSLAPVERRGSAAAIGTQATEHDGLASADTSLATRSSRDRLPPLPPPTADGAASDIPAIADIPDDPDAAARTRTATTTSGYMVPAVVRAFRHRSKTTSAVYAEIDDAGSGDELYAQPEEDAPPTVAQRSHTMAGARPSAPAGDVVQCPLPPKRTPPPPVVPRSTPSARVASDPDTAARPRLPPPRLPNGATVTTSPTPPPPPPLSRKPTLSRGALLPATGNTTGGEATATATTPDRACPHRQPPPAPPVRLTASLGVRPTPRTRTGSARHTGQGNGDDSVAAPRPASRTFAHDHTHQSET